ncbi:MAG: hypothetical protein Q9160_006218 [Pyrenula sp. 1 TL-2023]
MSPTYTLIACLILGLLFLSYAMGLFSSRNHFPVEGKTILLTGASSGLGLSLAHLLSLRGAHLILVSRDPTKLSSALSSARSSASSPSTQRFHSIPTDLRSNSAVTTLLSQATAWNNGIPPDIVWCCAGHCIPGFFADMPIEELRGQMDTLYWSTANTAHATINAWLGHARAQPASPSPSPPPSKHVQDRPTRHLILTASTLSFLSVAGYGAYSPAKRAILSLSDTLYQELAMLSSSLPLSQPAMRIHTLFPMGILSPGFEHENTLKPALTRKLEEGDKPQRPEDVAQRALCGLERGEYLVTVGFEGEVLKGAGGGGSPRNGLGVGVGGVGGLVAWVRDAVFAGLGWVVLAGGLMGGFVRECERWGANMRREEEEAAAGKKADGDAKS